MISESKNRRVNRIIITEMMINITMKRIAVKIIMMIITIIMKLI